MWRVFLATILIILLCPDSFGAVVSTVDPFQNIPRPAIKGTVHQKDIDIVDYEVIDLGQIGGLECTRFGRIQDDFIWSAFVDPKTRERRMIPAKCIEFGLGNGWTIDLLATHEFNETTSIDMTAIDLEPKFVERAKEKFDKLSINIFNTVDFIAIDVLTYIKQTHQKNSEQFDSAYSSNLSHFLRPAQQMQFFQGCYDFLKSGGYFFLRQSIRKCSKCYTSALKDGNLWPGYQPVVCAHLPKIYTGTYWDHEDLADLLEAFGFTVIQKGFHKQLPLSATSNQPFASIGLILEKSGKRNQALLQHFQAAADLLEEVFMLDLDKLSQTEIAAINKKLIKHCIHWRLQETTADTGKRVTLALATPTTATLTIAIPAVIPEGSPDNSPKIEALSPGAASAPPSPPAQTAIPVAGG